MSLLHLNNIVKTYGNGDGLVHALRGIDLSIESGESIAIMGTSGCGKSTLLNILGFVDRFTQGIYQIEGKDTNLFTEKEKANFRNKIFGFVVQDFALIPRLRVDENIMLPLEYVKLSKKEKNKKVDALLSELGILDKKKAYPTNLSGGQKQRVAIARALVNDARILLCDEPTGALDSDTTHEIMEIFTKLNREEKKTLIIVTHDQAVAKYCDRIIQLSDGLVIKDNND